MATESKLLWKSINYVAYVAWKNMSEHVKILILNKFYDVCLKNVESTIFFIKLRQSGTNLSILQRLSPVTKQP